MLPDEAKRSWLPHLLGAASKDSAKRSMVEELKPSIVVFREGVDFSVDNTVPQV